MQHGTTTWSPGRARLSRICLPRRLVLASLAALLLCAPVGVPVLPATASAGWCWDDPLVLVNGRLLDIRVGMPIEYVATMRTTTLTIIIPRNVVGAILVHDVSAFPMTTQLAATAPPWNGRGEVPVRIVADVQASTSYPIALVATPLLTGREVLAPAIQATGTANTPLSLALTLSP